MNPSRAVAEGCTLGAVPIPDVLRALLVEPGPSGHEEPAAQVWREAAAAFAEVESDTLGTSYARVRAAEGAPTLAVVGHIDEIGVAVTHIDESGLLCLHDRRRDHPRECSSASASGSRGAGATSAEGSRASASRRRPRDRPRLEHADLHIDIGARDRADAERLVRPGDAGVWDGEPVELPNGLLMSKALDNRLGAYVALESARRHRREAATHRSTSSRSRRSRRRSASTAPARRRSGWSRRLRSRSTSRSRPTCRAGTPARAGAVELRAGAMIARGPTLNRHVDDLLVRAAEEEGIPHAFEVYTRDTHTDADEIHLSRAGVPTGLISIPTRYVHSPCELCALDDLEAVGAARGRIRERLTRDQSFVR